MRYQAIQRARFLARPNRFGGALHLNDKEDCRTMALFHRPLEAPEVLHAPLRESSVTTP